MIDTIIPLLMHFIIFMAVSLQILLYWKKKIWMSVCAGGLVIIFKCVQLLFLYDSSNVSVGMFSITAEIMMIGTPIFFRK